MRETLDVAMRWSYPLVIMVSVPLATLGGFLALAVFAPVLVRLLFIMLLDMKVAFARWRASKIPTIIAEPGTQTLGYKSA